MGHPDLVGNLGRGWDFDNGDPNPTNRLNAHGTACAGLVAARMDGGGAIGVAPGCKIVPIRFTRKATFRQFARSLLWTTKECEVLCCAWTRPPSNAVSTAMAHVSRRGRNGRGIPIFCATGNNGRFSPGFPATERSTIAVGASTREQRRANYSNFGRQVDFVCPSSGGSLRLATTDVRGSYGRNRSPNGDYCMATDATGFGGTSGATAIAAGVAALVISANLGLRVAEIRSILRGTCDRISSGPGVYNNLGWSREFGYGRLNAHKAVQAAMGA